MKPKVFVAGFELSPVMFFVNEMVKKWTQKGLIALCTFCYSSVSEQLSSTNYHTAKYFYTSLIEEKLIRY